VSYLILPLAYRSQGRRQTGYQRRTNWRTGVYEDVDAVWLRWATLDGELLQTQEESLRQAEQRAALAEAELARLKAERER